MKKTPDINPESQDIAELQAMVKALMSEQKGWQEKEAQWQKEQLSHWLLGEKTGYSPTIQTVPMRVRCCTVLSKLQKLTG
ncbi:hypothetical protein BBL91_09285 [Vibrio parahaemolyticus]|nr:hypothetical protein BBL91_09285 [Vibrio parahaemolyticus]